MRGDAKPVAEEMTMKLQRLAFAFTVMNLALLVFLLARVRSAQAHDDLEARAKPGACSLAARATLPAAP